MKIEKFVLGSLGTNCYFIKNEQTKELVIVDPATCPDYLVSHIKNGGYTPKAIFLTHSHFDHVMAMEALRKDYGVPVYAHEEEVQILADPNMNLSCNYMRDGLHLKADKLLKDGDTFEEAGFTFRVMHTPGHTCGSCCYYVEEKKVLFAGDTLFEGSYGRIDFPTGSGRQMIHSVAEILFDLPDEVQVFPGHEGFTTIGDEKLYNPLAGYRGKVK